MRNWESQVPAMCARRFMTSWRIICAPDRQTKTNLAGKWNKMTTPVLNENEAYKRPKQNTLYLWNVGNVMLTRNTQVLLISDRKCKLKMMLKNTWGMSQKKKLMSTSRSTQFTLRGTISCLLTLDFLVFCAKLDLKLWKYNIVALFKHVVVVNFLIWASLGVLIYRNSRSKKTPGGESLDETLRGEWSPRAILFPAFMGVPLCDVL